MTPARFAIRAVLWTIGILVALSFVTVPTTSLIVSAVKVLHRAIGFPAPYLLVDLRTLYTTPVIVAPPLGLILASTWVPWQSRAKVAGTALLAGVMFLLLGVAVEYSPYLPPSEFRTHARMNLMLFAALPMPLLIWVLLIGANPAWTAARSPQRNPTARPADHRSPTRGCGLVLITALLVCLSTILIAMRSGPAADTTATARQSLARELRRGDYRSATHSVFEILRLAPDDMNIAYLGARTAKLAGRDDLARVLLYESCKRSGLANAYFREYDAPPVLPDR